MASAVRGQRKTEHGVEPIADPAVRRAHRRVAMQISAGALAIAAGATAGLFAV